MYDSVERQCESLRREAEQRREEYLASLPLDDEGRRRCRECATVIEGGSCCPTCAERERVAEARKRQVGQLQEQFSRSAGWNTDGTGVASTAGILPRWKWARLGNDRFRALASPKLLAAVEGWTPADGNLLLAADTGRGKSSLVVAWLWREYGLAAEAINAGQKPPRIPDFLFASGPDLVAARRGHPLGQGEAPLISKTKTVGLLLLDEVGFEADRDGLMFEIADERYRCGLRTVTTTGRTKAEFVEKYGIACWRRLTEGGTVVEDFAKSGNA